MKCHSFFQESPSPASCSSDLLPDHLLPSSCSSSSVSSTQSPSDPRTCPSSSVTAATAASLLSSSTLLYTATTCTTSTDIITSSATVVANTHNLPTDHENFESIQQEGDVVIQTAAPAVTAVAACAMVASSPTRDSGKDTLLKTLATNLHLAQVRYDTVIRTNEGNDSDSAELLKDMQEHQQQKQKQEQEQEKTTQLESYPRPAKDELLLHPPHTQVSQDIMFQSQSNDSNSAFQHKCPQETQSSAVLHSTPPAPTIAAGASPSPSQLQSGSTFCALLFSAQLAPSDSLMDSSSISSSTAAPVMPEPAAQTSMDGRSDIGSLPGQRITTVMSSEPSLEVNDISVICHHVQEQIQDQVLEQQHRHLQSHPHAEASNWFLNSTSSFELEPTTPTCLLSVWSFTDLSSNQSSEHIDTLECHGLHRMSAGARRDSLSQHICRKRSFADALEMVMPLRDGSAVHYPSWTGSIKRRKIHQFATKWTSGLAPSSFIRIYTALDFWDVMSARMDSTWVDFGAIAREGTSILTEPTEHHSEANGTGNNSGDMAMDSTPPTSPVSIHRQSGLMEDVAVDDFDLKDSGMAEIKVCHRSRRTTQQLPHPGQILRGLWEEEQQLKRRQQMVPDNVRRQPRSKAFKTPLDNRFIQPQFEPWRNTFANQGKLRPIHFYPLQDTTPIGTNYPSGAVDVEMAAQGEGCTQLSELNEIARNRLGSITTSAQRLQAASEGQALSEYHPWKDGTTIPSKGSLRTLHEMRQTVMEPWPEETSRAKDECTRILHRMREQLNIVINLQIHLRSLIKTAPTQLSFLLSIRHPGQVSIELLLALYGPHFMQTSNFRAIEQLLWGQDSNQSIPEQVYSQ
ncbi:hypothetical protein BG004_005502 [Podila humilis]|nr:hypothetical protein BG004_005502 [Podila humilis]